ncbi:MAG TPA: hypothetical protein DCE55_21140 [Planctomycetaceae bacterium]|nr:hypothetical protein [Planctomycetaceae bacterium]
MLEPAQLNRLPTFSDAPTALLAEPVEHLALPLDNAANHDRNNCRFFDRDDPLDLLTAFRALTDFIECQKTDRVRAPLARVAICVRLSSALCVHEPTATEARSHSGRNLRTPATVYR